MDTSSKTLQLSSTDSQSMTDCDFVTSSISEEEEIEDSPSTSNLSDESFEEDEEPTDWDSLGPPSHIDPSSSSNQDEDHVIPLENIIYGIPRLGDPLPVVSEGSTLPDDPNTATAETPSLLQTASTYEEESQEFHRDMNTTKVAFASYRSAVMHLVQHQDRSNKSSSLRDNERMSLVEESAKEHVEQKAQTFHDAREVAIEFRERGMERKKQRRALGMVLMNGKAEQEGVLSGLSLLKQLKEEKAKEERIQKGLKEEKDRRDRNTSSAAATTTTTKPRTTLKPSSTKPKAKAIPTKSKPKSKPTPSLPPKPKRTTQETIGVPRRKTPPRHPSCIKDNLPKFKYTPEETDTACDSKDNAAPMTYRTTAWIGSLVQWRKLRQEHLEQTLRTCGCPDCRGELEVLISRIDIRSR